MPSATQIYRGEGASLFAHDVETEDGLPKRIWVTGVGDIWHPDRSREDGPVTITEEHLAQIVANFERDKKAAGTRPVPIDFGHATVYEATNEKGRAYGWIGGLEIEDGNLYATDIEWSDTLANSVKDKGFKFTSPVIHFDFTDRVNGEAVGARISSVAVTNMPAQGNGLPMVASQSVEAVLQGLLSNPRNPGDNTMSTKTVTLSHGDSEHKIELPSEAAEAIETVLAAHKAEAEEKAKSIAELTAKVEELARQAPEKGSVVLTQAQVAEFEAAAKAQKDLTVRLAQAEAEKRRADAVAERRLSPKEAEAEDMVAASMDPQRWADVLKFAAPGRVPGAPAKGTSGGDPATHDETIIATINAKAEELMAKNPALTLSQARVQVLKTDRELAQTALTISA